MGEHVYNGDDYLRLARDVIVCGFPTSDAHKIINRQREIGGIGESLYWNSFGRV